MSTKPADKPVIEEKPKEGVEFCPDCFFMKQQAAQAKEDRDRMKRQWDRLLEVTKKLDHRVQNCGECRHSTPAGQNMYCGYAPASTAGKILEDMKVRPDWCPMRSKAEQ